jgi:hypothetical protein
MVNDTSTRAIAFAAAVQQAATSLGAWLFEFSPPRTIRERLPSHPVMIRA